MQLKCLYINPLSEDDLFAALDGDAPIEVFQHLQQCSYCAARRDEIARFESQLQEVAHPPRQHLLEYQFGLLNASERHAVKLHLEKCETCQHTIHEYESVMESSGAWRTPEHSTSRTDLTHAFNNQVRYLAPTSINAGVPTYGPSPITAGVPGASLFIRIEEGEDAYYTVSGQLIADPQEMWTNALVALSGTGEVNAIVLLNELGQFKHTDVPKGSYQLRVQAVTGETFIYEMLIVK